MPRIQSIRHGKSVISIRASIPNYLNQLSYPIYLGMPPLPLTTNKPIVRKGGNESVATIGGTSIGRTTTTSKSPSKKGSFGSSQRVNYGSDKLIGKKRRRANPKRKTKKKVSSGSIYLPVSTSSNGVKKKKKSPAKRRTSQSLVKSVKKKVSGFLRGNGGRRKLKRGKNGRFQ